MDFLIRIDFRDDVKGGGGDRRDAYKRLHKRMEAVGFYRFILKKSDVEVYRLPATEYAGTTLLNGEQVAAKVEAAVGEAGWAGEYGLIIGQCAHVRVCGLKPASKAEKLAILAFSASSGRPLVAADG